MPRRVLTYVGETERGACWKPKPEEQHYNGTRNWLPDRYTVSQVLSGLTMCAHRDSLLPWSSLLTPARITF